jgi:hypothetical protein
LARTSLVIGGSVVVGGSAVVVGGGCVVDVEGGTVVAVVVRHRR